MEQFHIILPSDSSMEFFSDNTTTCYTTKLPIELNLEGKWEVGLSEISLPFTFLHIRNTEDITVTFYDQPIHPKPDQFGIVYSILAYEEYAESFYQNLSHEQDLTIEPGFYGSLRSLIDVLNENLNPQHIKIDLLPNDYVEFTTLCESEECNYNHEVHMSERLFNLLGFYFRKSIRLKIKQVVKSKYPADILRNLPYEGYVYTNICEPHIVGNVHTTILRSFPIKYDKFKFGSIYNVIFASINYLPLISNSIRTIDIDIRDRLGKNLSFEFGTSSVTLHFRRIE